MLRRPKRSKNEVVAPKEEETFSFSLYTSTAFVPRSTLYVENISLFYSPLQPRNCQIPSLNHTVPCISCRKMYNIVYKLVSCTLSLRGITKLKISFVLFPPTCLSLHEIAFSFNYLAYCCYIARPYVCYCHLYSDLLLLT
jgi:hypothetical protein